MPPHIPPKPTTDCRALNSRDIPFDSVAVPTRNPRCWVATHPGHIKDGVRIRAFQKGSLIVEDTDGTAYVANHLFKATHSIVPL